MQEMASTFHTTTPEQMGDMGVGRIFTWAPDAQSVAGR